MIGMMIFKNLIEKPDKIKSRILLSPPVTSAPLAIFSFYCNTNKK